MTKPTLLIHGPQESIEGRMGGYSKLSNKAILQNFNISGCPLSSVEAGYQAAKILQNEKGRGGFFRLKKV